MLGRLAALRACEAVTLFPGVRLWLWNERRTEGNAPLEVWEAGCIIAIALDLAARVMISLDSAVSTVLVAAADVHAIESERSENTNN